MGNQRFFQILRNLGWINLKKKNKKKRKREKEKEGGMSYSHTPAAHPMLDVVTQLLDVVTQLLDVVTHYNNLYSHSLPLTKH